MSMPSSRCLTNKSNAQRSTGPRTAAGKRRSAMNAHRHGLSRELTASDFAVSHSYQLEEMMTETGWTRAQASLVGSRFEQLDRCHRHLGAQLAGNSIDLRDLQRSMRYLRRAGGQLLKSLGAISELDTA